MQDAQIKLTREEMADPPFPRPEPQPQRIHRDYLLPMATNTRKPTRSKPGQKSVSTSDAQVKSLNVDGEERKG